MLNRAVRELVRKAVDMPENSVRPANQNAPTGGPEDSFATVFITGHEKLGWDEKKIEDVPNSNNVRETITGVRRITVSVQFFKGEALARAARLQTMLESSNIQFLMQELGLGFERINSVQDLTGFDGSFPEERARVEMQFNVTAVATTLMRTYGTFPYNISTPAYTAHFEVTTP